MLHALGNKSTLISRIMLLSLRRVSYSSAILLLSRYLTHSLYNTFSYPFINPDNHLHLYIYIYIYKIIRKTSLTSKKASDPSDKLFYREILLLLRNNAIFISFYRRIIIIIYIYIHTFFSFLFYSGNRTDFVSFFLFPSLFSTPINVDFVFLSITVYSPSPRSTRRSMRETFPRLVSPNGSIQRPEEDRSIPIVDIDFRHADEFSEFRFPDRVVQNFHILV